jgi:glyoxylase-like metal-dependent hydrolase (beta-lactamase superfamily II)
LIAAVPPISRRAGLTNSPEDFTSLMNDLESKIFDRFADDTVVHPGHGDDTTLAVSGRIWPSGAGDAGSPGHPETSLQSQPRRPLKRH